MRSGSSRHRGYRLPRYGHSQNFGRAAIGRFHAFASKTAKSQERLRNRQGCAAVERDESSAQTVLKRWFDRPLRRALNPIRVSVDPFRDAVRRIFPGKTTVFRENPNPVGRLIISFRVERTLVRLDFLTTRTRDVGSHAWSQTKSGHGRDSSGSCASLWLVNDTSSRPASRRALPLIPSILAGVEFCSERDRSGDDDGERARGRPENRRADSIQLFM